FFGLNCIYVCILKSIKFTKLRRKLIFISNNCFSAGGLLAPILSRRYAPGYCCQALSGLAPN
ncbi:MAG: hypothetical protein B6I20_10255, partial [Bacteroidetes bacterium 4572_117]